MDAKELIADITQTIQRNASAKAAFGEPYKEGTVTVIPVAKICVKGGGGGGTDMKTNEAKEEKGGKGMGIGLSITTTPLGYLRITQDDAQFIEITDKTKIFIASAVTIVMSLLFLSKTTKIMMRRYAP